MRLYHIEPFNSVPIRGHVAASIKGDFRCLETDKAANTLAFLNKTVILSPR
jgi:hypothetical protein